jgi:hypothetical protein
MSNGPCGLLPSYANLTPAARDAVDAVVAEDLTAHPWRPLLDEADASRKTPQEMAFVSPADFLFYGGAAGGGKTDLLIGLALTEHRRSILFRREAKQLRAITDRVRLILRTRDGFNAQQNRWRLPDERLLDLGGVKDAGDEQAYQGQPHDLIGFDELPQFLESQFRFLAGWNRTTDPDQRCRVVGAGNPPASAEGEWVIRFWAPWLDPQHANPALPGELRWFAALDGEDVEVDGPEPFEHKGERLQPKSRSFIPSSVEDNPFLTATGYKAMLQALPEPLRSQMLRGDFTAGRDDDPWQVIPTEWVLLAQQRWQPQKPAGPMHAMGVDVARGGADETVLTARYGDWFAPQIVQPGAATPNGQATAALTVAYLRDDATAHVDVIGVGASAYDHLDGLKVNVVACNAAEASLARDRSGQLGFVNRRAEWWWKMREALDPHYGEALALPPDRALRVDLCTPRWKVTARGIQVEAKEDIVKRLGRSPDRGDSAVLALQPKRPRRGAFDAAHEQEAQFIWRRT